MKVLTIPNWSFCDDRLLMDFKKILDESGIQIHYLQGDVDHHRTVSAFSGEVDAVIRALENLAELAFSQVDLSTHQGVHPKVGVLDVCPFVLFDSTDFDAINKKVQEFASYLAEKYELPCFLYEKSSVRSAQLPSLRAGGYSVLVSKKLDPDFGPDSYNKKLGATVIGIRDFLIAMNVNLDTNDLGLAQDIARKIRTFRDLGNMRFQGVRALGFELKSRGIVQVSFNLTLPDATSIDSLVHVVDGLAREASVQVHSTELIGVIRKKDLSGAYKFFTEPKQIIHS